MKIGSQNNGYMEIGKFPNQKGGAFNRYAYNPKISFRGDALRTVSNGKITYKEIDKIINSIDGILGKDGYLASKIQKANIPVNSDKELVIKEEKLSEAVISTLKYPIADMPFDIINWICNGFKKTNIHVLEEMSDKILNVGFIRDRLSKMDVKRNYELVIKILDQFCEAEKLEPYKGNVAKLADNFTQTAANKITKTAKAYASRDERTLNRIVTGGIGAILSSYDMYNISMLEKDDKKSAKKAEKDRRDQELTRVFLSAGLTFLTLGIFDKFAKGSYILSSMIIAGSTLFAEVVSRIRKHKPLVPLSPERAQKIAQRQEYKKSNKNISSVRVTFDRINKKENADLYKDFTNMQNQENKSIVKPDLGEVKITKPAKNKHIGLKLIAASILCSLGYLIARYAKGEYNLKIARNKLLQNDALKEFLKDGDISKLPQELIKEINSLSKKAPGLFDGVRDKITKRNSAINVECVKEQIERLLSSENAKEIAPILEVYEKQADFLINNNTKSYTAKVNNTFTNALYEGFTKIFKTLYTILSSPAQLACYLKERQFKDSEKAFDEINKIMNAQSKNKLMIQYKKELAQLNEMLKKCNYSEDSAQKIAKTISNHAHNFEKSAETSDLANFSRTLVTMISSYFYVNDFRNTVLIESEGQNTQRAKEVMNDSISFKLCNFFFNGTLMNLFNSIFKTTLNGSLVGATAIAAATEVTNEFLIRKTIARPMKKLDSRDEIVEFERSQANRKGFAGWWTRNFKKLTGQKSLVEKYEAKQLKKN